MVYWEHETRNERLVFRMENHKLRLKIGPVALDLTTGDDPEYVTALATALDGQFTRLLQKDPRISATQALAFLTLQAYDDAKKSADEIERMRATLKTYLEDVNRYRELLEDARMRVAQLEKQTNDGK